jgi:hypothetical protein
VRGRLQAQQVALSLCHALCIGRWYLQRFGQKNQLCSLHLPRVQQSDRCQVLHSTAALLSTMCLKHRPSCQQGLCHVYTCVLLYVLCNAHKHNPLSVGVYVHVLVQCGSSDTWACTSPSRELTR